MNEHDVASSYETEGREIKIYTRIGEREAGVQEANFFEVREIVKGAGEAFAFFLAPFSSSILSLLSTREER